MKKAILSVLFLTLGSALTSVPATASSVLYDNTGPRSYTQTALGVTWLWETSNSFTLKSDSTANGATVALWVQYHGTTTSLDWAISTSPFSGDLASGTATNLSSTPVSAPDIESAGYDIHNVTFSFPDLSLSAGTYWLHISNAGPAFAWWDEAWGEGEGASQVHFAFEGVDDGISWFGSSTFQILGTSSAATPEPSSILLVGSGLLGLGAMVRRKLKA